jgi:hypothetical protein
MPPAYACLLEDGCPDIVPERDGLFLHQAHQIASLPVRSGCNVL